MMLLFSLNWIFCISTALLLVFLILKRRYLLIKPSVLIVLFFHLRIQWAATVEFDRIVSYLPNPLDFFILVHAFPFIGILVSMFFLEKGFKSLWNRVTDASANIYHLDNRLVFILVALILIIVGIYIFYVPFTSTGLFTIFTDPLSSNLAREESLGTVTSPIVRYGFNILMWIIAPILFISMVYRSIYHLRKLNVLMGAAELALLPLILIIVSLPGARSPAAMVVLAAIYAVYLRLGMPIRPVTLIVAALVVLAFPVVLSILREDRELQFVVFWEYLSQSIFRRVFEIPMEMGLYHAHYAQTQGFIGVAAMPRLAAIWGVDAVNVPNLLYWRYTTWLLESGMANACYVFSYYCYFGIITLIPSLVGLWILDLSVVVMKKIKNHLLLLATLSALAISAIQFVETEFTIGLFTKGFIFILLFSFLLDRIGSLLSRSNRQLDSSILEKTL
jgi:hypothetical protein